MKKVLISDCHDSFVYNLLQLVRETDDCTYDIVSINDINFESLPSYTHILLSPGPGLPEEFPDLSKLIDCTHRTHSILGVCLGLQAIGEYFGGKLIQLPAPLHGHTGHLTITDNTEVILKNLPHRNKIGHYHSWLLDADILPSCLRVTATDEDGRIMAIRHNSLRVRGVQFHPESIITKGGKDIIYNWLMT